MIDLRLGHYADVLADVIADAVISDPPYGARTHAGHAATTRGHLGFGNDGANRLDLEYRPWTGADVSAFVDAWAPRCRGWLCAMTSHDLVPAWIDAAEAVGRYAFAPVAVLQHRPRLGGDGPGSCVIYLCVSRPRETGWSSWGSLPGWYEAPVERGAAVVGAKPLGLMRAIVRDYTRPGDLVCDPCAGGATTLLAAEIEGRRAVGSELDPATFAKAQARIARGHTPDLFSGA